MECYEVYKDSGVEWLGEIPAEWEVKKLKYEVQVNPLKDNLDQTSDELVTFLSMDSISENGEADCSNKKPIFSVCHGFTFFRKNDVIVAKITPCFENGKCVLLSDLNTSIGFGSTEFHVLRPKGRIFGKFLYYITKSETFMQSGEAFMYGAAGQKRIPSGFISDFPLVLPNVDEQTAIANFLDRKTAEIDALIAQKERLLELYEEEKTAIINHAVTKGLDPNAELKDSGVEWVGEIPAEWEVKKLKYVAVARPSNIDKKSKDEEEQVSLCNYVDVYKNEFINRELTFMSATATQDQIEKFLLQKGDILATKDSESSDDIANPALVVEDFDGVVCGYHLTHIKPKKIIGSYLFRYFQTNYLNSYFEVSANGVTRYGLGVDKFDSALILNPTLDEQTAIANFIDRKTAKIDAKITKTQRIIELQKEYRTALISEVVTGKIRVQHLTDNGVSK